MLSGLKDAGVFLSEYGILLGALAGAGIAVAYFRSRSTKPSGEVDMGNVTKAEYEVSSRMRRIKENEVVEEMFLDGLLKLLIDGKLSDQGYRNWMNRFGRACSAPDMLRLPDDHVIPPTQEKLKAVLKKRRNGGTYHGIYEPPSIPGPKPGERNLNTLEQLLATKLNG